MLLFLDRVQEASRIAGHELKSLVVKRNKLKNVDFNHGMDSDNDYFG